MKLQIHRDRLRLTTPQPGCRTFNAVLCSLALGYWTYQEGKERQVENAEPQRHPVLGIGCRIENLHVLHAANFVAQLVSSVAVRLRGRAWTSMVVGLVRMHERLELVGHQELIAQRHCLRAFAVDVKDVVATAC